jgi:N-acetyl-alpha-D-glucosaminyl L-malate synthase BshA
MAASGHTPHLFARTPPFRVQAPPRGVRLHTLGRNGAAPPDQLDTHWSTADRDALVRAIVRVAASPGLDVLHFHYGVPFAGMAAEVRRRLGRRIPALVGTLHGTDVSVHAADPVRAAALAASLGQLDALTTVSRDHAALVERTLGLTPDAVIPNFVDLARFRPAAPTARSRRPRIAHVSNFRAVKDPETMARAFVLVRRAVEAELWLIGDGEAMLRVRAILRRGRVERDVRWLGLRDGVELILPGCDLLLVTSRTESFCVAALEAMACGVPVVAPRVGGLPELVTDGETGLLYDPGDPAAAARAALRLLHEPGRAEAIRRAGLRAARRFANDVVVPRYEALYRSLLPSAPRCVGEASGMSGTVG